MAGKFRWFAMAVAAVVLSGGASVAQAAPPEKEVFPFEGSVVDWVECPDQGFNIRIDFFRGQRHPHQDSQLRNRHVGEPG